MQFLLITFVLDGLSRGDWESRGKELAATYMKESGLVAKIWLHQPDTDRVGAVYLWDSDDSIASFLDGPLMQRILGHPNYADIRVERFEVLDDLTRLTQTVSIVD